MLWFLSTVVTLLLPGMMNKGLFHCDYFKDQCSGDSVTQRLLNITSTSKSSNRYDNSVITSESTNKSSGFLFQSMSSALQTVLQTIASVIVAIITNDNNNGTLVTGSIDIFQLC